MRVAVLSDSHDHVTNTRCAVSLAAERGATHLFHCGDLVAPFMLRELAAFPGPVHVVFGNNDGDILLMTRVAADCPNLTLHGQLGGHDLDGREIAFTHTPNIARPLAASGLFSAVFFGHTHLVLQEYLGGCLLLNPGDIMGKDGRPSFALYNPATHDSEIIVFEQQSGP
ncbi:MAG: YfcE family phosphodiesterase [Pseudomonadota bacterium]